MRISDWSSDVCSSDLERLFAALRSFYCLLISKGRYDYTNPLEGDRARELIEEERHRFITQFSKANARLPMPVGSGIAQIRYKRNSAAYFRLRGDLWLPEEIGRASCRDRVCQYV